MANVAKLKELRNALVNFEENFDYTYILATESLEDDHEVNPICFVEERVLVKVFQHNNVEHNCGTVACLAGFTVALHKEAFIEHCTERRNHHPLNAMGFSESVLELSSDEGNFLFTPASKRYEIANYYDHNPDRLPFPDYPYDDNFYHFSGCTKEQGYNEALRRLDYIIEYYSNKFNIA
jgi:hypothetical protein